MDRTHLTVLLEATMNALAAGIFLVGHDGHVHFSNRIADSFAKAGDALRVVNGRLVPADRNAAAAFQRLIDQPSASTTGRSDVHETIAFPRAGGGGLVATITAVSVPHQPCAAHPLEAAFSVIVQDPALSLRMPGEAFARLYCLTAAELRVALAMVPGARPQTAAEALGISSNTVKTHLQRIFEKTETSRQADLIALMLRTTPPVMS
ncbi:MAG: helix-turn-helix transcriptional regulator [Proteobacteria bacterium]|nr:helix-turn-helix transcriptional regulator [Pseudomonadota bacterium]